jgi:hypothetical protein
VERSQHLQLQLQLPLPLPLPLPFAFVLAFAFLSVIPAGNLLLRLPLLVPANPQRHTLDICP